MLVPSENSSSGLIEKQPIKWNTLSAPLLTSLLNSPNTIPANRTATTIAPLLQSHGSTSSTSSGKLLPLLPLIPSIRITQGTPTLSKLLEAPANPYISSLLHSTQYNKLSEVGTEKLMNTSRKVNSQSTSLNRVPVDNITTLGSFNQINKSDLSASKRQISKTPVSAVKNGSKAISSVVNLLSYSNTEEDTKNTTLKSSFGDKKDTSRRLEPRATRSQTRAEGGFKQLNDNKLSDGKKERESLRQQSGVSQINETHLIDDDLIEIDQIEVEPLSSVQDEIQTQTSSKITRSSLQRLRLSNPGDNLLTNNKVNTKELSNKTLEEKSANYVSNILPENYKCLLGHLDNSSDNMVPVSRSACIDAILARKESQTMQDTLTTYDGKLLKETGVKEIKKGTSIMCIDGRNDSKFLSFINQPIVVVNKIKKPFNIKFASEQRNKTNDILIPNTDVKKSIRLNNSSLNVVKLIDSSCSLPADEVIIIDDDININEDDEIMKAKDLLSKPESKTFPSTVSSNSKSTTLQMDEKKNKNDKTPWNMFGKAQNILDTTKKHSLQDSVTKGRSNSNINESNNQFIKELDFDFDQSISQTSMSELYNGVEEIVEMDPFDNEELNSLIECGSLDSNETEECIDTVGVDQGDSSVSESDSTIGAFDTFAQITRVRQKSFTSKDMKDTKESKTTNQGVNHLKESLCQSEEIYDDQSSSVSVTGIPVLQGVLSDVMSQIDLDSVAPHKTITPHKLPITDVVEISSDEDVPVDVPKAHPLSVTKIQTQEKEMKYYKLKDKELIQINEIEAKKYKGVTIRPITSTIKPINIEMPPCIIVTNITSDTDRITRNKILENRKDGSQKYDNKGMEMMKFVSNTGCIREENELNEAEVIQPHKITVKISNEKLIRETERMKKEAERKKKDDEKMKQADKERKKKEDDERKKKVEDERKKIEERKNRELEKKLLNELYERKKKEEEERKNREDKERKKKEEYERKIKELQEKMKIEERKRLEKIEEEKEKDKKLNDNRAMLREKLVPDENNQLAMRGVVVKEEIVDEGVDNIDEEHMIDEDVCIKDEDYCIKDEDNCIKDEDYCIKDEDYCIKDEDNCIKDEDICIKELQEKMKIEEERKRLEKIEEEKEKDKKLNDYRAMLREKLVPDENNQLAMRGVVVKEEIVDEGVDNIDEEHMIDEDVCIKDEDYCIKDEDNCIKDEDYCIKDEDYCIKDEDICIKELQEKMKIEEERKRLEKIEEEKEKDKKLNDYRAMLREKLASDENNQSAMRIEVKENIVVECVDNILEELIDEPRDVQVHRGYIGFQRQSIEQQSKKAEEAGEQKIVEAKIQSSKEADEMISRKVKVTEMKRVKEIELEVFKNHRIKIAKEVNTKKHTEAELRKNIAVEETYIKGLDKTSTFKKIKELENNRSFGHPEVNLLKNYEVVPPVHFKKNIEHVENDTNIEQELIESRKAPTNHDFETFNLRERGIRKCMGSEGKTSKEIETKSTEVKMITRTRGLKVEEKLKDFNVSKNLPTKLRPQIKSSGSSSTSACLTSVENPSNSSYEYKKQTVNTDDNSKRNTTSNTLYDKNRDLNNEYFKEYDNECNEYFAYNEINAYNESNAYNENAYNENIAHYNKSIIECDEYNDEIYGRIKIAALYPKVESVNRNLSHSELTQIRDCELQSIEESIKSRFKIKKNKRNEDLRSYKELKVIIPRDVQKNRGYIGFQRQSIEQQSKKVEEAGEQKIVEAEIQSSKEAEDKRADEMISRKVKVTEMKRVKEIELEVFKNHMIKIAKEVNTKKHTEAELRKNIAVEETYIKGLDKTSTFKKIKELENNRSFGHPEVNLLKNYEVVPPVHFKKNIEHVENDTNIEQELIKSRKAPTNRVFKTYNLRERGIRKCMGSEGKTSKEIETKSTEVKMITRTRGLKVEEKLKDFNVSKNLPTKSRPQIKSSGSSSTSVENPSNSSYEYKKQTVNTDDNSKRNTTSNTLYDKNRDLNIDPSVIVRKENLNREVIGITRTRTRSSSFKQKIVSETKSSKEDQDNGAAIIPKETVGTKTILSTSTGSDHQTSRTKSLPIPFFNKQAYDDINRGKTLIIPVVMLTTSELPLHIVHQRSVNNFIKQQEIKSTHDQIPKQILTTTQLDKMPPKKRGRKRRIDVQNEKHQESNSTKTTSQNVAKSNTSIEEAEPPAKRTRMSLKLRKIESENKTHDQIPKQIVTTTQLDKMPPKKRGRKRRIDVQNEKHLESNSSTKTTSQNVAKSNTSIKKAEPPAKRTRRKTVCGCRNDSINEGANLPKTYQFPPVSLSTP